jgi:hypothetical protein
MVLELLRCAIAIKPNRRQRNAVGPASHLRHLPGDLVRMQGIVGIKEFQVSPLGASDACVSRCWEPAVGAIVILNPRSVGFRHRFRVVVRSVIDDDDLDGGISLSQRTINGLAQVLSLPIAGDDDGNQQLRHSSPLRRYFLWPRLRFRAFFEIARNRKRGLIPN